MKCSQCGSENKPAKKFCTKCGSKLVSKCPRCDSDIEAGDDFCGECGLALIQPKEAPSINYSEPQSYTPKFLAEKILTTRSSIEGERKLVTVLFADVANYTSISEKLDPEEVHQIMEACFKILIDEIHKYEGTINQFTGDGVMALFGAPVAHEDHAQRACYAALAVQRAIVDFNEKLKEERNIDFRLRIGINSGPVVVGSIGDDLRMDYTALGDTTNLAARMQQSAEPGSIIMADSSYKLIRNNFIVESLGESQVKGKGEPVLTYLLKHARSIRTLMDIAAEKGLSPLQGRSEQLNRLHQFWELSKKGHGQVVFIVGEAGIGKSRLVFEFHRSLGAEKITWLEGHSTPYGGNMPFLPLIDLLKRNFRIEEGDSEEIVSRKIEGGLGRLGEETKARAPYLKFLLSVDPGDPLIHTMDAQGRRRMTLDSIRLMTIHGSKIRPLILIFEDLHWMDHDSEECLKYFIDSLATIRFMLILTYRPGYVRPFGERTFFNRISLKALGEKESLDLSKGVIGASKLPEYVEPLILDKAEGNPFYLEEITKSLQELGAFERVETIEAARGIDRIHVPTSIQDIIMARIDRLPEEQKETLQTAAVIGRKFVYGLLERIAQLKDTTTDILGDLVGLELIYQTEFYPEFTYMFKHALTHEVVYNSLLTSKRRAIHAKAGEVIEEMYSPRLAEHYEIVAHHYEQGQVWDKAVQYLVLSGEKALGNMANPSAHSFFEKAIDICSQKGLKLSADQEYAIYQGRGNAEFNMGRVRGAEADFFQAREVAKRMGDQNKEGESLSMAGWSLATEKRYEEAIDVYHEAIDFGREIGNPIIEGRNLVGLGLIKLSLGYVKEAETYIEQAVEIGEKINSQLLLTFSLSLKGLLSLHCGTPDEEAIEYLNRTLPLLKSTQNARACVFVYLVLGYRQSCIGDYAASISTFQKGIEFAEQTGEALNRAKAFNWLGWVYSDLGWISRAKTLNEQSHKAAMEIGSGSEEAEAHAIANLAENAVAEGDYEQAEKYIEDLLRKAETGPGYLFNRHRWEFRLLCTLGEISLHKGESGEAIRHAQRAFEIAEKTLNKRGMIRVNRLMGEIYINERQFSKAEEHLNEAIASAREIGNPPQLWKTYFAFGQLREAQGLNREAKVQYKEALQVIKKVSSNLRDEEIQNIFLNSDSIVRIRDRRERL